ncbi:DUF2461 domain-containing protein [Marinilongibacter aquaticus]|uniref:DUF2461 domain-containing protein n=1 Tax=Marinilongibacter aquaticus TaxID=2975157 RepID=UPI0021BD730D|nr:DUF2461 domain-containing protein [Marinilongibacter aquaticus]UBM58841.1 DUF2461 domain-containing protein [Marinilongibacter aquaticus]
MIDPKTLHFLSLLKENNQKEWFQANRELYEMAKANFISSCADILDGLKAIQEDLLHTDVKKCVLRINRDIRFSKDKNPYKVYFGAGFGPGGKSSGRADFYLQIEPEGKSFLGGGMWGASAENLAQWRQEIDYSPENLKGIIEDPAFTSYFNQVAGDKLKTSPKGYAKDHPEIELLRYKEMFFYRNFSDQEVCSAAFADEVLDGCRILKPYLDYVNELLFEN